MACCRSAGYKAVPVSKGIQSSELYNPDSPVRITQQNVGQYFVPENPQQDTPVNQYGYPTSPPLKPRDRPPHLGDVPPCPQKHGQYDASVPPPHKEAHLIHQLQQRNKAIQNPLPLKKQLFPRSRVYEMQGFKERNNFQQPLDMQQHQHHMQPVNDQYRYSPETGLHLNCSPSYRSETLNPYVYNPIRPWYPQPQFWYFGNPQPLKPTWPVGHPDDYKFEKLPYPSEGVTLLEKMEIDRPERYLPGEIYRAEPVKRAVEDLSKNANCSKQWQPKDPTFCDEFTPDQSIMNRPRLLDEVLQRKEMNREQKNVCQCKKPVCNCSGIVDTETKEKNKKDPNTRIDSLEMEECRETCSFGPDLTPKPDACDLTKKKSKLPIGVMRKIDPHISEQEYMYSNMSNEMKEIYSKQKKKCNCGCKEKKEMIEQNMQNEMIEQTREKCKCGCKEKKQLIDENIQNEMIEKRNAKYKYDYNRGDNNELVHQRPHKEDEKRLRCNPIEPGLPRFDPSFKRACELSKVGQPFKSDAIRQHTCVHPPPRFAPIFHEGKRKFPDFGLSHI